MDLLLEKGACYKAEDGAIMYRSAQLCRQVRRGQQEKDRRRRPRGGQGRGPGPRQRHPHLFAADIAYHYNKLATRGFDKAIDVWGADHHGHVARMKGAMDAIGLDGSRLDVVLMQMVNLMQNCQPVRMSKRTGNAITLTDLLEEVPIDSARFLFNMHEPAGSIDFDLDQAVKTDNDNPVYYVQYAHARICSILRKLESTGVEFLGVENVDATLLDRPGRDGSDPYAGGLPPARFVMAAEKYDPSRIQPLSSSTWPAPSTASTAAAASRRRPRAAAGPASPCASSVRNVIRTVLTMFKINVPDKM